MEKISHSTEITIFSAEDLSLNKRSIKKNAFVIIQTDPHNHQSTTMDTEGGSYPSWNQKFNLSLPSFVPSITLEVKCKAFSGVRTVGTGKILFSDFMGDYIPINYLHFLRYRLRDPNGEANGIINLSFKMVVPEYVGHSLPPLRMETVQRKIPDDYL